MITELSRTSSGLSQMHARIRIRVRFLYRKQSTCAGYLTLLKRALRVSALVVAIVISKSQQPNNYYCCAVVYVDVVGMIYLMSAISNDFFSVRRIRTANFSLSGLDDAHTGWQFSLCVFRWFEKLKLFCCAYKSALFTLKRSRSWPPMPFATMRESSKLLLELCVVFVCAFGFMATSDRSVGGGDFSVRKNTPFFFLIRVFL